jgi:beta-lactamase regulating signal transducer with metallopeptidase domain
MSLFLADTPVAAVAWLALKATALLAAAALLQMLWRRRTSAATRHLTWTLVVAGLLLLPAAWRVAPRWSVATIAPPADAAADASVDPGPGRQPSAANGATAGALDVAPAAAAPPPEATGARGSRVSVRVAALGLYVAGLAGVLLSLALHHWRARRLAARATHVIDGPWAALLADASAELGVRRRVRLLRSREVALPMTFGTQAPAIVIPATADLWPDDRRRAVLLHELAHVARYDCLTQTLALVACAAYWPHPAVWWVARQLRLERELACDDRVLAAGAEPRAYAGHLLEIAYSLDGRRAPALAVSMARPSQLEGRMLAALDPARNRRSPGRVALVTLGAVASVAVIALAGATPVAIETTNRGPAVAETIPAEPAPAGPAPSPGQTAQDEGRGTWELKPSSTPGMVHLRISERNNTFGTTYPLASLEGLTEAQLAGAGGPVQFRITRDAGTLVFEGVLRGGVAGGTFSFTPNPAFPAELVKRGFTKPTAREQYQLARADVGYAFLDELNRLGYAKPDIAGLVTAGQHGVDTTYLREMAALGYALGTLPPLITLRDHGVGPDYVRGMAEAGYAKLPADTIRQARDHGVGPEYVKGMRDAGYAGLPLEALIDARDHGVTPEYVRALADGGHRGLPLEQVVRVRDHGITPDYVGGMRQLGYTVSIEDLVRARDHGVSTQYAGDMAALGYARVPIDRLIKARDHGVTPEYAKELKALGYDSLTLDDLVLLRDHGVTPDKVRSANARAGSRLPIDILRSMADGGGLR